MRHEKFWIAGAALVLMATACNDASSITGPQFANAKPAFDVVGGSHTSEQDIPWGFTELNPCNDDWVTSNGSTHFVSGSQVDNSGGIHLSDKVSSRGTGVGLPPAFIAYKVNEQLNTSEQMPEPGSTWLEEQRVIMIAPKPELNYTRHMVFKWTINSNGITTVFFERAFTKCGGETMDPVDVVL